MFSHAPTPPAIEVGTDAPRVLIVSNRLPVTLRAVRGAWRAEPSAGGLSTALSPVVGRSSGLWIGSPGDSKGGHDPQRDAALDRAAPGRFASVELPPRVALDFYEGYANQTLWPLFHHFPTRMVFAPETWSAYLEANRRFADRVLELHRPGDLIWVHDYHLLLVPQLIREALPQARIGFFLHIPFPSSDVFRVLPRRDDLLRGMLGADLLGFQTHEHLQHFRHASLRLMGLDSRFDCLDLDGRAIRLEAFPVGIAPAEFTSLLDTPDSPAQARLQEIVRRLDGRQLLIAVDRLDYTKGIPERLRTFRRLLTQSPSLRGRAVLLQVAVPSREQIPGYQQLRRDVNELVGSINGEFGTADWTPITYLRQSVSRPELVALYAAADVGWVTPLRDGMNLVAKEYVACQRDGNGVLVLSEFAGAAAEMGEAFLVNPYDEERTAHTIERALTLPLPERRERMRALQRRVDRNNTFAWAERFLSQLDDSTAGERQPPLERRAPLPVEELRHTFRAAAARWLLLDYDGTLVPIAQRPVDAHPTSQLLETLGALEQAPATHVAVVSGRQKDDLERWFGHLGGLTLIAEHGAVSRHAGEPDWRPLRPTAPLGWKPRVQAVLDHIVHRTPGSFVEEKEYGLVWHHRMADPEFGEWIANELLAMLDGLLADTELRAVRGHKSVEVRFAWAHKGECLAHLGERWPAPGFCLVAGDDRTDEDLFEQVEQRTWSDKVDLWTVKVGPGPSRARYQVLDPAALLQVLGQLREAPIHAAHARRVSE